MSALQIIVAWGLTAIVVSIIAGLLAGFKNRDYSFWMAWSFILPPMIIVLAFLPRHMGERPKRRSLDDDDRHHPF